MLRLGLVFLTWSVVTINYYNFSHSIHHRRHFEPPHGHGDQPNVPGDDSHDNGKNHGHHFDPHGNHDGPRDHDHNHDEHHHGRGAFQFDLQNPRPFLNGLALPLLLLTLLSLVWNPSTSAKGTTTEKKGCLKKFTLCGISVPSFSSRGEVNVQKWTLIWFVLPLLLVMMDGAIGSHMSQAQGHQMGWGLYIRICMSLMSPSGYAATWALSLFLIPVTKHSPILDWLSVTPVQALAFHRVAGWTGLWNSVLHGFLHLRHLMDVLNPGRARPWQEQLKILLIPASWECIGTQNPWEVFWGRQDPLEGGSTEEANQCWLALVNATGMISVIAFVILAATSLPQVRRYSYALFYRVHIPAGWIMLITAIWHYPTCALVLIPNIIYYLSFNIPLSVQQKMEHYQNNKKGASPLVEANLIQGGSIELVFATIEERDRHESRFAKIYCPSVSPLSHPFSVFSRSDLGHQLDGVGNDDDSSSSLVTTLSILLKPTGQFTEGLTKVLFSNDDADDNESNLSEPLVASTSFLNTSSLPPDVQFDSYYAASFDWIDHAMESHDEILLIAGGVGIVPFLEFLPNLAQRIDADSTNAASTTTRSQDMHSEGTNIHQVGPRFVHLHWYCREIGLASYVFHNHLRNHIEHAWESNAACQGRLKIHIHLTSLSAGTDPSSGSDVRGGEQGILLSVANSGLQKKQIFAGKMSPAHDAPFTQSWRLGLLLPGSLMLVGTMFHWWWYKQYILDDKFRDDNLVIRSHSIIFTLLLAVVLSISVEHYLLVKKAEHCDSSVDYPSNMEYEHESNILADNRILTVSKGRPVVDAVISDILKADRPGVYSCGPSALMESVETSIKKKHRYCAFYREDSEM